MTELNEQDNHFVARWRLVLGDSAEKHQLSCAGDSRCERAENLIGYLFDGDTAGGDNSGSGGAGYGVGGGGGGGGAARRNSGREGGRGSSTLTVPEWVDQVSELFPNQAKEVLEREFVNRRGIGALLKEPRLLEKVEPNVELVKTLLTHKHLLNPDTRVLARKLIAQVVEQLKNKMRVQVEQAITGAMRRDRHSPRRVFRNLDVRKTLYRNLQNFDEESGKLYVDQLFFFAAERKKKPWHIIVTVDQSGSMLDSAIFSAVMASIFYELPAVRTSMVLFDTQIVDISDKVGQPVDVLLSINLGGGTDIAKALQYSHQLVRQPSRTIVVLITDFFEGRPEEYLVRQTRIMAESGIRMIGLGALGYDARPAYNKHTAANLRKVGMDIMVCTPERLAECMGEIIRG